MFSSDRWPDMAALAGVGMILYGLWRVDPAVFFVAGGLALALIGVALALIRSRSTERSR